MFICIDIDHITSCRKMAGLGSPGRGRARGRQRGREREVRRRRGGLAPGDSFPSGITGFGGVLGVGGMLRCGFWGLVLGCQGLGLWQCRLRDGVALVPKWVWGG